MKSIVTRSLEHAYADTYIERIHQNSSRETNIKVVYHVVCVSEYFFFFFLFMVSSLLCFCLHTPNNLFFAFLCSVVVVSVDCMCLIQHFTRLLHFIEWKITSAGKKRVKYYKKNT